MIGDVCDKVFFVIKKKLFKGLLQKEVCIWLGVR